MRAARLTVQRTSYRVQVYAQDALKHAAEIAKYLNPHLEVEKLSILGLSVK
jgi:ATP-dependent protease HslVU (ClpYQ) peptidase subunit